MLHSFLVDYKILTKGCTDLYKTLVEGRTSTEARKKAKKIDTQCLTCNKSCLMCFVCLSLKYIVIKHLLSN